MDRSSQRGSAILMLFIAVALFGMLSYAFLQGTRSNTSMITNEASKAASYQSQDCTNSTNLAAKRLETRGCTGMISYNMDGTNDSPGAPTDGSCSIYHPNGGGVKDCANLGVCSAAQLLALTIGERCGGIVYAGISGGRRIYTTPADQTATNWNNGNFGPHTDSPADSTTDGLANTNALLAFADVQAPYKAAQLCRTLGPKWYLPAQNELTLLYTNRTAIGGFNLSPLWGYWSSTEDPCCSKSSARTVMFSNGATPVSAKANFVLMRCVRRD